MLRDWVVRDTAVEVFVDGPSVFGAGNHLSRKWIYKGPRGLLFRLLHQDLCGLVFDQSQYFRDVARRLSTLSLELCHVYICS